MVTMGRYLTREERAALRSGTKFVERFTLGLYAPEFSDARSEVELELVFDRDSDWGQLASHFARYDSELIGDPCSTWLYSPTDGIDIKDSLKPDAPEEFFSGGLALFGASAATISAIATMALCF